MNQQTAKIRLSRAYCHYLNQLKNRIGLRRAIAIQKFVPVQIRKSYAKRGHFFWKPCPKCNEHFGGFEIKYAHSIEIKHSESKSENISHGQCICPSCSFKVMKYDDYNKICLGFTRV